MKLPFLVLVSFVLAGCQLSGTTQQRTLEVGGDTLTYEIVDGLALYGGDMILGDANEIARRADEGTAPQAFSYADEAGDPRGLWPNGVIPYVLDSSLTPSQQADVERAIAHWSAYTPYTFVERDVQEDYVRFVKQDEGCSAYLGYGKGERKVKLAENCDFGSAVHEIGHVVGLRHEHQRCDRDEYIEVLWDNIASGKEAWFEKLCAAGVPVGDYDYSSVMHYVATAASKDGEPTLRSKGGSSVGWRESLGPGDIAGAKARYETEVAGRTITIYAAGQTNQETMQLKVKGRVVKTWDNIGGDAQAGQFTEYSHAVPDSAPYIGDVAVAFTNDDSDAHNLRVDRIEIGGRSYQVEEASTYSTGSWTSADGCMAGYKTTEWLHCNGQFEFFKPQPDGAAGT